MSLIILNVDEVRRTLSASGGAFVVHDKEVDIVRFAINSGFADIVLDGQVALRVMYTRPGETEVRAQTLTYYDTDGLHNYYDWQLLQSDLTKDGSLMVALCILDISGGEVSEWHTTPCAVRVLSTIHTDDSDEGDAEVTPTVKERVAVLESMIQRVASGAPIVVASTSAMTDTDQIYVLKTDGQWYYHNGSAWVAGGEYGAVSTDTTLTQSGIPADAKTVGDAINNVGEILSLCPTLGTKEREFVPSGTDIDTMLTPGEYKIETLARAKTMINLPNEVAGILTVSTMVSNAVVLQIYRTSGTRPTVYVRGKPSASGAWGDWRKVIYDTDFASTAKITVSEYASISEYTDLDTITTPGEYKVITAAIAGTLVNSPLYNVGYNLRVFGVTSSNTICQMIIGANNNLRMYVRFGVSGSYSEWKLISYDVDTDAILSAVGSLGTNVTKNTERIVTLENAAGISGEYLTAYTTEEQALYDKVNNDIDSNTLVFVVSTDNHYRETTDAGSNQAYHAEIIAKMAKRLRADAIINLGDIITQYVSSIDDPVYAGTGMIPSEINTRRLAKMASAFQSAGVPFLYTIAHHEKYLDSNGPTSTDYTTQTSVYPYPETKVLGLCGKGAEWLEEHHYTQDALSAGYYVDFERQKVRVIFYDSVGYTACGYTPASISFITEAFSAVPAGYKVIVCTHVASRAPGVYSAQIKNWEQVEAIMQNFTSGGGTILGELHGHSHFDNVVKIEGVPYPYICICCAENSWSTVGEKIEAGVLGNPVSYKYHAAKYGAIGTYNEWLFDVVCVHPDRDTINLFRFGIGEDRSVTLGGGS